MTLVVEDLSRVDGNLNEDERVSFNSFYRNQDTRQSTALLFETHDT